MNRALQNQKQTAIVGLYIVSKNDNETADLLFLACYATNI